MNLLFKLIKNFIYCMEAIWDKVGTLDKVADLATEVEADLFSDKVWVAGSGVVASWANGVAGTGVWEEKPWACEAVGLAWPKVGKGELVEPAWVTRGVPVGTTSAGISWI